MICTNCPCPGTCLGWPSFCGWAAEDPPDEVKIRHICARSAMAASGEAPKPVATGPSVAEALALVRRVKACPFRSTGPDCGCQGGRCSLRQGAIVSHLDCFDCVRKYEPDDVVGSRDSSSAPSEPAPERKGLMVASG
jgi:hypothetical protein